MSTAAPSDMSDRLSPMLVKELRQGLRAKLFVVPFIALQGVLIFAVLLEMTAQREMYAFWTIVTLFLVVLMPLRGLGSIGLEMRDQTLELIQLTRQSALRIALGKWTAGFAQVLLFAIAVLPYLLLRYYASGAEASSQLYGLGAMLLVSAILYAINVGFSAYLSTIPKLIGAIVIALAVVSAMLLIYFESHWQFNRWLSTFTGITGPMLAGLAWLAVVAVLFVAMMLEVAAHRLDPASANHAGRVRALGLAILVAGPLAVLADAPAPLVFIVTFLVTIFACLHALVDVPIYRPTLARPFVRGRAPGILLSRFAYPGWSTGYRYATGLMVLGFGVLLALMVAYRRELDPRSGQSLANFHALWGSLLMGVALLGTMLLPVVLTRLVAPESKNGLVHYLWIQLVFVLSILFLAFLNAQMSRSHGDWLEDNAFFFTFLPPGTLGLMMTGFYQEHLWALWFFPTLVSTLVLLAVLTLMARPHDRRAAEMEQIAREVFPAPSPPAAKEAHATP